MTGRIRLPNRRSSTVLEFELRGLHFTASYSCSGGKVLEIFLQNHKPSSQSDSNARDAAVAASLALQHGCSLKHCSARYCARRTARLRRRSVPRLI
jgi:hypothetical protein